MPALLYVTQRGNVAIHGDVGSTNISNAYWWQTPGFFPPPPISKMCWTTYYFRLCFWHDKYVQISGQTFYL